MEETIVISVGGSLICPAKIDIDFLMKLKKLVLKHAACGRRFIIITGGGRTARDYQEAARKIATNIKNYDVDWLGIHATRLNAHLVKTIFGKKACQSIVLDPTGSCSFNKKILIAGGWKPGFSTDLDAVMLAQKFGIKSIINLSNIDYVYSKDPKSHHDAKQIESISWKDFRKIVGNKWSPGLNAPFDPVASRECEKNKITVIIMNGKKLERLDDFLNGRAFKGTTIK